MAAAGLGSRGRSEPIAGGARPLASLPLPGPGLLRRSGAERGGGGGAGAGPGPGPESVLGWDRCWGRTGVGAGAESVRGPDPARAEAGAGRRPAGAGGGLCALRCGSDSSALRYAAAS